MRGLILIVSDGHMLSCYFARVRRTPQRFCGMIVRNLYSGGDMASQLQEHNISLLLKQIKNLFYLNYCYELFLRKQAQ